MNIAFVNSTKKWGGVKTWCLDMATALREQGDIKSISKPQVVILSGTHGMFKNGGKERIIGEIMQQILVTGATVTSLPSSAKTEDIPFGFTLEVDGDVYGDTIWGNIAVSTDEVIDRPTTTINGAEIQRPTRAQREIKAPIRALPGQTLLLGGSQTTKRTVRKQGVTGFFGLMPLPGDDMVDEQLSELILVVQPKMIVFEYPRDNRRLPPGRKAAIPSAGSITEPPAAMPAPQVPVRRVGQPMPLLDTQQPLVMP
jgi:hypothetical protein